MNRRHFLISAATAVSGCHSLPVASRMGEAALEVPGEWAATHQGRAGLDSDWLKRLGDSRLEEYAAAALKGNPDLKIAAARVEQSRSLVRATAARGLPQVDLTGRSSKSKRNFVGFPFGAGAGSGTGGGGAGAAPAVLSNEAENYETGVQFQWELDVWGRIRAGTAAAASLAQAAELELKAARASLVAQVARAWFGLTESREQAMLAKEALKAYEDTAAALEERFRSGQSGEQGGLGAQLRLARSDVASARAALEQREEAEGSAARALEVLAGRYPGGSARTGGSLPELRSSPPAGLPSALLLRRPDVLAAERKFAAQGMRRKEARRAVFPRISLTGNKGYSSDSLGNLLNSDFGVWSLGGSVVESIFTGGQVVAEIRKRNAEEQEAMAALQKTVLKAFSEVEDALAAEDKLQRREAFIVEASRLAMEADTEARANFRQGTGDLLTVLATQNRTVTARSQVSSIRRLRLENRIALHLALGGDFTVR